MHLVLVDTKPPKNMLILNVCDGILLELIQGSEEYFVVAAMEEVLVNEAHVVVVQEHCLHVLREEVGYFNV